MELTGNLILGNRCPRGGGNGFYADEPSQDCPLAPEFFAANAADVDRACQLAEQAFDAYRALPLSTRADFLTRIGENILALGGGGRAVNFFLLREKLLSKNPAHGNSVFKKNLEKQPFKQNGCIVI